MVLRKLSRQTLSDQAVDSLLEYIEESSLKPGDILPSEALLTTKLGVSRPVIREALKALAGRNVVEIVNGKGAIIKPIGSSDLRSFFRRALGFDPKAIRELLECRQGLEVQAAQIAAKSRTEDDVNQLRRIVTAMRKHLHDAEGYIDADLAFHLCVVSASHNSMLYYLIESIRDSTRDSIVQWHQQRRTPEERQRVQHTHETVYEAIKARDVASAAEAMNKHFDDALYFLNAWQSISDSDV